MVVFKRSIPLVVIYLLTGEWVAGSAGMGFTPHIITIPVGEVRNGTFALVFNMQSVEFFLKQYNFFIMLHSELYILCGVIKGVYL